MDRPCEPRASCDHFSLTWRETEVLRLVASGLSPKSIAGIHGVQWCGVEIRISHIVAELNAEDSEEMVTIAREHGLLED